jgi:DNA polymerase
MSEVPGRGNPKARGLILGEAPGAEEERLGRPFIGPSGRLLSEALAEAGLEEDELWITNVIKTRPPDNRTPTGQEVIDVLDELDFEISSVEPEVILALGNIALFALTGEDTGVTRRRGHWETAVVAGAGIPVLPCMHPAFVRRNRPKYEDAFRRDVAQFAARVRARFGDNDDDNERR